MILVWFPFLNSIMHSIGERLWNEWWMPSHNWEVTLVWKWSETHSSHNLYMFYFSVERLCQINSTSLNSTVWFKIKWVRQLPVKMDELFALLPKTSPPVTVPGWYPPHCITNFSHFTGSFPSARKHVQSVPTFIKPLQQSSLIHCITLPGVNCSLKILNRKFQK